VAVTLGSNVPALQAQRSLSESTRALNRTYERLSSGLRINHAGDDAAGLSISESLKADTRVYTQAVRNINDGLGLLSIADSAIENLSNIVIRIKELAEQSANGVYGASQRSALEKEAQKLSAEFNRIVATTEFNDRNLLTAETGSVRLQGGYGQNGGIASTLGGAIGNGEFGSETASANSGGATSNDVKLADVNNDGALDIVSTGSAVQIRLGNGDGTFRAAVNYTSNTADSALADMNGDGRLDVIGIGGAATYVLLGNGDGSFAAATSFATSGQFIAVGDINGDGSIDAAVANGSNTTILLGTGSGNLVSTTTFSQGGSNLVGIDLADFNNDGKLDVAATAVLTAGGAVALGRGDGTFGSNITFGSTTLNQDQELGDFNNDGNLDIVVAGINGATQGYSIFFGRGDGYFSSPSSFAQIGFGGSPIPAEVAVGDINGDGNLDVLTSGNYTAIHYRLGNGDGTFSAATSISGPGGTMTIGLGDIDGDGVLDLVSASDTTVNTRISQTTSGTSPLLPFSLATRADALQAMAPLTRKLAQLSAQRGSIGAFQSRLSTAVSTIQTSIENYSTAASRLTDADIAEEAAQLTRGKILQQSSALILAQANLQPEIALKLLSDE